MCACWNIAAACVRARPLELLTLVASLASLQAGAPAVAHETETPVHYVAEGGIDRGECDHPEEPCATIEYAIQWAEKGDEIHVAGGRYAFRPHDPAEVVTLLSPALPVLGGYSAEDGFRARDPDANPTVLTGGDEAYAERLGEQGLMVQAQAEARASEAAPTVAQAEAPASLAETGIPRYVAPDGSDTSECSDIERPCASIPYALSQAEPGDAVLIASGTYLVPAGQAEELLRSDVTMRGGAVEERGFATEVTPEEPAYVVGPPPEMREALARRGLTLVQDRKGLAIAESIAERAAADMLAEEGAAAAMPPTPCDPGTGKAGPYDCKGVDFLARIELGDFSTRPAAANDIWGFVDLDDKREYAIIGLFNGTAVVDVTDPENPVEIGTVRGQNARWRDVKVYQFRDGGRWKAYAYVTADFPDRLQGLQIIDLSDLPNSVSLAATWDGIGRAHNVYIANVDYATGVPLAGMTPVANIAGSDRDGGAFFGLDLSNPVAPSVAVKPPAGTQYIHDGTSIVIEDARARACRSGGAPPPGGHNPCELFVDFNENTLDLWDVTDRAAPLKLSSTPYPNAEYTHSGWWSKDKRFVFVQDELDEQRAGLNTTLRAFDISDLTQPVLAGTWSGTTHAIDHNGFARGDTYYMSNYRRGLTVLDVTTPSAPTEKGFFDTFPLPAANSSDFNGAWGVYPFLPSGTIVVSDIEGGLFILRESRGREPPVVQRERYDYAVKLVCGVWKEREKGPVTQGAYGTVINIANVGEEAVRLVKRVALTIPPGRQEPGREGTIGRDAIEPRTALKTDCPDIAERVFGGSLPDGFIEGFVLISASGPLDVSAVYSAGTLGEPERVTGDVDVERITPRAAGANID